MNTNKVDATVRENNFSDTTHDEFNNVESVEGVYSADAIDIIDSINAQPLSQKDTQAVTQQAAANDVGVYADIFSLNSARRAKHDKSLERRISKSLLTDRRSSVRLSANGEEQVDRRAENRAANIQAIRQSISSDSAKIPAS